MINEKVLSNRLPLRIHLIPGARIVPVFKSKSLQSSRVIGKEKQTDPVSLSAIEHKWGFHRKRKQHLYFKASRISPSTRG